MPAASCPSKAASVQHPSSPETIDRAAAQALDQMTETPASDIQLSFGTNTPLPSPPECSEHVTAAAASTSQIQGGPEVSSVQTPIDIDQIPDEDVRLAIAGFGSASPASLKLRLSQHQNGARSAAELDKAAAEDEDKEDAALPSSSEEPDDYLATFGAHEGGLLLLMPPSPSSSSLPSVEGAQRSVSLKSAPVRDSAAGSRSKDSKGVSRRGIEEFNGREGAGATSIPRDAIDWILAAPNPFVVLRLPMPSLDDLGAPVWSGDETLVKKQYRKLVVRVHPDKNRGNPQAQDAFEKLNQAYKMLLDEGKREDQLREVAAELAAKQAQMEPPSESFEDQVAGLVARNQRLPELRRQHQAQFQAKFKKRQAKRSQNRAERSSLRKRAASVFDPSHLGDEEDDADGRDTGSIARHKKHRRNMFV